MVYEALIRWVHEAIGVLQWKSSSIRSMNLAIFYIAVNN